MAKISETLRHEAPGSDDVSKLLKFKADSGYGNLEVYDTLPQLPGIPSSTPTVAQIPLVLASNLEETLGLCTQLSLFH